MVSWLIGEFKGLCGELRLKVRAVTDLETLTRLLQATSMVVACIIASRLNSLGTDSAVRFSFD